MWLVLMSLMRGIGEQMRRIVILRFGRRMCGGVTLQRMDGARIVLLRRWRRSLLPNRALHPAGRRGRLLRFGVRIAIVFIAVIGPRRRLRPPRLRVHPENCT